MLRKKSLWIIGALIIVVVIVVAVVVSGNKSSTKSSNTTKPASSFTEVKNSTSIQKKNSVVGVYLTDLNGKTLYTSDADQPGVSNCDATCIQTWPIYAAKDSTNLPANWTTIKRADGTLQYAYKGKPLYYFVTDAKPGDITGNNLNGFHVAKP